METVFENQYTRTKDCYSEYYKHFYFATPILIVFHILFAIIFALAVLSILFPNVFPMEDGLKATYICLPVFLISLQACRFFKSRRLAYSRDLEQNKGKAIETKISITENEIRLTTDLTNMNVELATIKKVIQTKNYFVLASKAKIGYIIKKDGFTKGDSGQFKLFLKNKGLIK